MSAKHFRSTNPATGELLNEQPVLPWCDVSERLYAMEQAQTEWASVPVAERARIMAKVAERLLHKKDSLALLITAEMGKVLRESMAEISKSAACAEWYAQNAEALLQEEVVPTEASRSSIRYRPLGVILGIMPWNFPFWQVFRSMVPILMAGNGYALKHAPNTQLCAEAIVQVCEEAGLPKNLVVNLPIEHDTVAKLIADSAIQGVTLTGSTQAGRVVGSLAGAHLKKAVLELGGSDAFIVLPHKYLARERIQALARMALKARMINNGQSCIAAKRVIVVEPFYEEFVHAMAMHVRELTMGNPLLADVDYGPMARPDLAQHLYQQVKKSLDAGAEWHGSGPLTEPTNAWFPAGVLSEVNPLMPAYSEELFGPVAVVLKAIDEDHAVHLANDTPYGLGVCVTTDDVDLAMSLEPKLQVGSFFLNEIVRSDFRMPFGGVKQSGFSRELGRAGLLEFCNIKTIWQG